METLLTYLLKVSVSLAMFYALHMLLLRKETFLRLRRGYFAVALVFSLLYPFINLNWTVAERAELPLPAYLLSEIVIVAQPNVTEVADSSSSAFTSVHVLIALLLLGSTFLLLRFVMQLISLFFQLRKAKTARLGQHKLVMLEDNSTASYSFFHWIVINTNGASKNQIDDIVRHEKAHSSQWHSVDVVAYEIICILFWWNPFVWLLKNEMKLNLEYLADQEVQKHKEDTREYQYTLLQISIANTGVAFINNFNISQLKKRITMMNKKRTSKIWSVKFLMVLPLALTLVLGNVAVYATPQIDVVESKDEKPVKKDVFMIVDNMPRFPGGESAMMKFIGENLRYPVLAQEAQAQGRVVVRYIVSETGKVTDVELVSNRATLENEQDEVVVIGYGAQGGKSEGTEKRITLQEAKDLMTKEAIRVVEAMPDWEPGKQNGKAVSVYYTLPILFRLK